MRRTFRLRCGGWAKSRMFWVGPTAFWSPYTPPHPFLSKPPCPNRFLIHSNIFRARNMQGHSSSSHQGCPCLHCPLCRPHKRPSRRWRRAVASGCRGAATALSRELSAWLAVSRGACDNSFIVVDLVVTYTYV